MPEKQLRSVMSYRQLVQRVREWNLEFRLKEKYHSWALRPPLPKVVAEFYLLAEHALLAYILQNISWVISDCRPDHTALHIKEMKSAYSRMNLGTSISSETFNFSMILMVKLVSYFLSNHVRVVLVDLALECDIYRQTLLALLGIEIEQNTYRILLRMFRSKRAMAKERESVNMEAKDENEPEGGRTRTLLSITRRNGKHEPFFNRIADIEEERARLQEIKFLLKSNLYVKPVPQRPEPKYSIDQLKQRQQPMRQFSLINIRKKQSPQKFTIQANQLSHAFSSNSSLKLTDIKNHSIHCTHTRKISRPLLPKEGKRLEIKREEGGQEERKGKVVKNWTKIVTEMKEELYRGRDSRLSEEVEIDRLERRCDLDQGRGEDRKVEPEPAPAAAEEVFKFRRLNLMNSPNIIVYDDSPLEREDLPNQRPALQIKANRKLHQSKKRENTAHLIPQMHKS